MKRVIIEFSTDDAVFDDDWDGEVGRLLERARAKLFHHGRPKGGKPFEVVGNLLDTNGNTVGHVRVEDHEGDSDDGN